LPGIVFTDRHIMTRDEGIGFEYLRRYRPDLFEKYSKWKRLCWVVPLWLAAGAIVIAFLAVIVRGGQEWLILGYTALAILFCAPFIFGVSIAFYLLFVFLSWLKNRALKDRESIDLVESTKRHHRTSVKILTELQAREIGARIVAHAGASVYSNSFNNATIIDRSTLIESMNSIKQEDASLADSLQVLAGVVHNSNDPQAIETLNEFNKKVAQRESKITLRALWDQIVKLVPDVATIGEATLRIMRYLGQ
jgi:hypothetical protein